MIKGGASVGWRGILRDDRSLGSVEIEPIQEANPVTLAGFALRRLLALLPGDSGPVDEDWHHGSRRV